MLFDPILRAPLIACISMGVSSALLGVCLLYEKRSLVGEALSHAAYPGVVLGVLLSVWFSVDQEVSVTLLAFLGAICTCCLGACVLKWLRSKYGVSQDGALSFVLSSSFAFALLAISILQAEYGALGRLMQSLLVGQAANVSDTYATICALFSAVVVMTMCILFRSISVSLFDREFALTHGLEKPWIEVSLLLVLSCSVMIGIRTMGVVLLTSAFIFPAICSRYLARSLKGQLCWASILGGLVSMCGVLLSNSVSKKLEDVDGRGLWLPTGPLIALLFMALFMFLFLFAWSEGFFFRTTRASIFHFRCICENALKGLWKMCSQAQMGEIERGQAYTCFPQGWWMRVCVLGFLRWKRYIRFSHQKLILTSLGLLRGQKLVRLHRLWELYLVRYCGMAQERVHPQAEEMEHVLTKDVERELTSLLRNPTLDPHSAPIPPLAEEILLREGKTE